MIPATNRQLDLALLHADHHGQADQIEMHAGPGVQDTRTPPPSRRVQARACRWTCCVALLTASVLGAQAVWAADRQMLYVVPGGSVAGNGTADAPFMLTAGREYEFNRLIRRASDAGKDIEVVFRDGVYADVRLQIIKQ
ncbi:hypothetical protein, partial [Sphaerotilus sp.]|uniref:hypothetical protein n=1 Tax=Sphaerotilus sp. TaxID=2093942 RepID=UPI0034E27EEF